MQAASYVIRRARVVDGAVVLGIERAAATRFASIGMHDIAQGVGLSLAHYDRFVALGVVLLCAQVGARSSAREPSEELPVGFIAACMVDGACHIAELDVLPQHAGHRLGSRLIDESASWAQEQGGSCLSLTTFRNVPWNAPYYARLGFRVASLEDFGPGHSEIWEGQRAMGLDMAQRVLMVRSL